LTTCIGARKPSASCFDHEAEAVKETIMADPVRIQRDYYRETAADYDRRHVSADDEHAFALAFMISAIKFFGFRSILDVGSGTGRALLALRSADPTLTIVGIEPSPELRARGHAKG
jgi:ubiquinone/menaquinone biosynthesis C-methylase UbiE